MMKSISWILLVCLLCLQVYADETREQQIEKLIKQLQDADSDVRSNAAMALGNVGKDAWRVLRSRLLTSDKKNYMLFLDYEHWQRYLSFLLKESDLDSIHFKINRHFRQLEHSRLTSI